MDNEQWNDEAYRKCRKIIVLAATACAIAANKYRKLYLSKDPYRGEALRGLVETERIIGVSDTTCRSLIRMSRRAFFSLAEMVRHRGFLYDSKFVTVEEQLVIYLHTIGHNAKNRVVLHQFGHSGETISRYFNRVLCAILQLHTELLKPPRSTTQPKKYLRYFNNCIGAIDGTHIPAWVSVDQHRRFRDRKGNISQNILAACDFDMRYTYILSGWEGSASDSRILDDAIHKEGEEKIVVPRD
ncbi:protein ALP1-like [Telopea speciosissima]|uniref:protein ALP1-like n=1 Tax=Telopea speciosissima TaxID=54955 RepID=UPI001CC60F21|nr:protein ALP1-like [Telopea speciosissima]